jgi:hypothetical protein
MATVASHGPHASHPVHPAPHPAHPAAPHPHHHPHHPPPRAAKKHGHGGLWAIIAVVAAIVAGAAWHLAGDPSDGLTPEERLVKQMQTAATGAVAPTHVFGGGLEVSREGSGLTITAKDVPSKACVSAAWRLAREGVVSINGITPVRISAGKLSELCADGEATISWAPKEQ